MIYSREQPERTKHWPPKHRAECGKPPALPGINSSGSAWRWSPGDCGKRPGSGRRVAHVSCYLTTHSAALHLARPVQTAGLPKALFLEFSGHQLCLNWLLSGTCCRVVGHSGLPCPAMLCPKFHVFCLGLPSCVGKYNSQFCPLIFSSGDDVKYI